MTHSDNPRHHRDRPISSETVIASLRNNETVPVEALKGFVPMPAQGYERVVLTASQKFQRDYR